VDVTYLVFAAMTGSTSAPHSYRRILLDMQISDSDPGFLSNFDARKSIDAARMAGGDSVMVYFQSHTGLCNWPTKSGKQHEAFLGKDPIAEAVEYAKELDMPLCAYYSINFNNQAWRKHPDWRFMPAAAGMIGGGLLVRERYGICCLNNPEYRDFVEQQVSEILDRYDIQTLFYDMVWWMGVCTCGHCRDRLRDEESAEIPVTIDWLDPAWCRFQSTRERWLTEFAHWLRDLARERRDGITVYHNFALGMMNWTRGVSFESAKAHDFLGGDFYGGRDEQLVVSRLMINLSETRPVEFMTTVTTNLAEHETLKPPQLLTQQCLAATANGSAMLMIAGMDPDGTTSPAVLDHIAQAFRAREPFDKELGGEPVEQIAVYVSDHSRMTFAENGEPLSASQDRGPLEYPHFAAVKGACTKLQRAHLSFGVITTRQLSCLDDYDVIVLPDLLRITQAEADAFRHYVRNGGCLYASRMTSLTDVSGTRYDDFMLADLFGCHFGAEESGRMLYLQPEDALVIDAFSPQRYLRQQLSIDGMSGCIRLASTDPDASVLATLNTPFGHPSAGSVTGGDWASIHSSPPWSSTGTAAVVRNSFGEGRVVYSAANIEADDGDAHTRLFVSLIKDLMPNEPVFEAEAHPATWLTVFDQAEKQRLVISLLNYTSELPAGPSTATLTLKPPAGMRFSSLINLPGDERVDYSSGENGELVVTLHWPDLFAMYSAHYEDTDD